MCLPFSILLVPSMLTNSPPLIIKPLELEKNDIAVSVNGVMLYRVVDQEAVLSMLKS